MDATLQSIFTQAAEKAAEIATTASTILKPKQRDGVYDRRYDTERRRTGYIYSTRFILREPRMNWYIVATNMLGNLGVWMQCKIDKWNTLSLDQLCRPLYRMFVISYP